MSIILTFSIFLVFGDLSITISWLCTCKHILKLCDNMVQASINTHDSVGRISSLERTLAVVIPHIGQEPCTCPNVGPHWSFSSQILTIPFLWKLLPYSREVNFKGNTILMSDFVTHMVMALQTTNLLL